MKTRLLIACIAITGCGFAPEASGQGAVDNDLKRMILELDNREGEAVFMADFSTVEQLWAPDLYVNNPFNQVVEAKAGTIRSGTLTYSSFEREAESVQIHDNTAIVMGRETVVPKNDSPNAGQTIHRRYTNIWMNRDGQWLLTARHASVICPDPGEP